MIIKIIGVENKMGNFQGRDYDNLYLSVLYPFADELINQGKAFGNKVDTLKVKSSILPMEKAHEFYSKNTTLEVYFDQYKNPVLFNPIKS